MQFYFWLKLFVFLKHVIIFRKRCFHHSCNSFLQKKQLFLPLPHKNAPFWSWWLLYTSCCTSILSEREKNRCCGQDIPVPHPPSKRRQKRLTNDGVGIVIIKRHRQHHQQQQQQHTFPSSAVVVRRKMMNGCFHPSRPWTIKITTRSWKEVHAARGNIEILKLIQKLFAEFSKFQRENFPAF